MKKARKILFFSLIATAVIGIVLGFVLGGSAAIGSFMGGIHKGFDKFERDNENGTKALLYAIFAGVYFVLALIFAIQVRRKKSKAFPIYAALTTTAVLALIFAAPVFVSYAKNGSKVNLGVGATFVALAIAQLAVLTVISIPAAFEHSELQANAKKSDGFKIADIIVGAVVVALFVPAVLILSGSKFDVFSHMFKNLTGAFVAVVIIQIVLFAYFAYRLAKQKKPVAAILFPLSVFAIELVGYTYHFYGHRMQTGLLVFLTSGNIVEALQATFVIVYFFIACIYGMYIASDYLLTIFEARRQKLYNHREKYVYGDRRKFGDSIVKEWEASKNAQVGTSFADIAAAIEAQKAADLRESQGLQGIIVNEDDITNNDEVQASLQAEQLVQDEVSAEEAAEDDSDDKKTTLTLTNGQEPTEFREKLMTLDANKRSRYNKVRNRLMSYKKIKQKFSKTVDTYRYAGELVAKLSIIGSTLRIHLALDPDSYDVNKYHQIDLSAKQKYIFVPFTLKLKGPKSVELALQLIDELMKGFEIPQAKGYVDQDYAKQVAEELKAEGLLVETPVESTKDEAPAETTPTDVAAEAVAAEDTVPAEEPAAEVADADEQE